MKISSKLLHSKIASEIENLSTQDFIDRWPNSDGKVYLYEEAPDSEVFEAFDGGLAIGFKESGKDEPLEYRFRLLWIDSPKFLNSVKDLWGVTLDELENNFSHPLDYVIKLFKSLGLHKLISQSFFKEVLKGEVPAGKFEGIFWIGDCPEWYYTTDTHAWTDIHSIPKENEGELSGLLETEDPRLLVFLVKHCDLELVKTRKYEDPRVRYELVSRLSPEDLVDHVSDPSYIVRREVVKRIPSEHLDKFLEDQDKEVKLTAYLRKLNS